MASLRDIRKRIKTTKNTQKITKAMKMVSAAKLKRAVDRVTAARPYADKLNQTVSALARRGETLGEAPHPLLGGRPRGGKVEVLAITSDRGLCGAFNSNVSRRTQRFRFDEKDRFGDIGVRTIGKKGFEALKRDRAPIVKNHEDVLDKLTFGKAKKLADELSDRYAAGELDGVFLVYNKYKSAISQEVVVEQLLPVKPVEVAGGGTLVDYEFEPGRPELLGALLPRQIATQIYRALLESVASEHGARMTAMDNASKNAKEMVSTLTLFYNRARQAAITKELMEIIGGAEALKG